jgi:hypothetical protein
MTRRDRVTPEMAAEVFARDGGCIAPRLGAETPCWGRLTIEHVKRELRMGKRGDMLVSLCEGHTEPGTRAGVSWNATKVNREKVRAYLAGVAS